jgi:hypothetical protein
MKYPKAENGSLAIECQHLNKACCAFQSWKDQPIRRGWIDFSHANSSAAKDVFDLSSQEDKRFPSNSDVYRAVKEKQGSI